MPAAGAGTLVPLYSSPPSTFWSTITGTAGKGTGKVETIIIANPNSGPGSAVDSAYTTAINSARAAGAQVIGYVASTYGAKSSSTINAEIDTWYSLYPMIDGIFVDEATNDNNSTHITYYTNLNNYIHGKKAGAITVTNPGTTTLESYMATADIIVVGETDPTALLALTQPSWVANYPASRFAYLSYGATQSQMTSIVSRAVAQNIGYVFVTSDALSPDPWDNVPTYWSAEVSALEANEGASPPAVNTILVSIPALEGWGGSPWARNDSLLSVVSGRIRVSGTNYPALKINVPTVTGASYQLTGEAQPVSPDTTAHVWVNQETVNIADFTQNGAFTVAFTGGSGSSANIFIGAYTSIEVTNIVIKKVT